MRKRANRLSAAVSLLAALLLFFVASRAVGGNFLFFLAGGLFLVVSVFQFRLSM